MARPSGGEARAGVRLLILSGAGQAADLAGELAAALAGKVELQVFRADALPAASELRWIYAFQPQVVHLFGLDALTCRSLFAVAARVATRVMVHLPVVPSWEAKLSADDGELFRRCRDDRAGRPLPRLRWSALASSWQPANVGTSPGEGSPPHPLLAAVILRLAAAFSGAGSGDRWLAAGDPRPLLSLTSGLGESQIAGLLAGYARIARRPGKSEPAAASVEPLSFPAAAAHQSALAEGKLVARLWRRLSGGLATPNSALLRERIHADLLLARRGPTAEQQALAEELHRLLRAVLAREKRSLQPLLAMVSRDPAAATAALRRLAELPAGPPEVPAASRAEIDELLQRARWPAAHRAPARGSRLAVLVLTPFLARGGAEQELAELLHQGAASCDFTVVTLERHRPELGDRRQEFAALAPLYDLGALGRPALRAALVLALVELLEVAVVYGANGCAAFYEIAAALRAVMPKVAVVDHLYDHQEGYVQRFESGPPPGIDGCLAENPRIAAELRRYGLAAEQVMVLPPCPRRPEELPAVAERPALRQRLRGELGLRDGDVVFLCAARLHEQKRPFDLLALASRLSDLEHLRWLLVGGGELAEELDQTLARLPGLPLRRLPFRSDVPALIAAADVGCLVSAYEGMPVFLIECLQLGVPCLGTRVGGVPELLESREAGLVAEPGDLDALEKAARRLADPAERRRLAAGASAAGAALDPAARTNAVLQAFAAARTRRK